MKNEFKVISDLIEDNKKVLDVEFYEDPYDTYELVVDLIQEDLEKEGVVADI